MLNNFTDFIEDKGFEKANEQTYIYLTSDQKELTLYIDRRDYIIPVFL